MRKETSKPQDGAAANPTKPGAYNPDPLLSAASTKPKKPPRAPVVKMLTLEEVLNYQPPAGTMLVGDGVIEAGGLAMLFGPPGSYKGFAIGHLMACGARGGGNWLGFDVRERFASLWVNCENTERRLKNQFGAMQLPQDAGDYIFNTEIPTVWDIAHPHFVEDLRAMMKARQIKLLIIDTVSCFTADENAKDFAVFLAGLNTLLADIPWRVAVLLVHHARKPKDGDRSARGLLHTISGHQTLQRRSRCIIYLGRVTDELDERRVVAACLKCSDSMDAEGRKVAVRLNDQSELEEIPDFDWSEWTAGSNSGNGKKGRAVTLDHLGEVLSETDWTELNEAAKKLMELTGVCRSSVYEYFKLTGPYGKWLEEMPGTKKNQKLVRMKQKGFE